jgi:hypothetical protein
MTAKAKWRAERKAKGLCMDCPRKVVPGCSRCRKCLDRVNAYCRTAEYLARERRRRPAKRRAERERQRKRIEDGLCIACPCKAEPRRTRCRKCLDKVNAYCRTAEFRALEKKRRREPRYRAIANAHGHARRVRLLGNGGSWTAAQFSALCAKYRHRCLCCGKRRKLTADHVVPVSKGGSNDISNIQPLCGPCNSSKNCHRSTDYRLNPHPNCLKA